MSPIPTSEIGAAPESRALTDHLSGPHWGWGTGGQLWACRVSQALGLLAILAFLLALTSGPLP